MLSEEEFFGAPWDFGSMFKLHIQSKTSTLNIKDNHLETVSVAHTLNT